MLWLVDGMNVIGTRPDGWWKDRHAAMERLVDQLETWAAGAGEKVIVVFEAAPLPTIDCSVIDVTSAPEPGPNAADEEIVRRLRDDPPRGDPRGHLRTAISPTGCARLRRRWSRRRRPSSARGCVGAREPFDQRERGFGYLLPAAVDRQRVAAVRHLNDLGDGLVSFLALVGGVCGSPTAPCGPSRRGGKWSRWDSNPRVRAEHESASTGIAGALISPLDLRCRREMPEGQVPLIPRAVGTGRPVSPNLTPGSHSRAQKGRRTLLASN